MRIGVNPCYVYAAALPMLAALVMWTGFIPHAPAQTYPQKPVRIILPYLGGTDFAGRWIAAKLSTALGQQVVIDPRPGAGGKIGHELLIKSPPDGYTLMLGAPPMVINPLLTPKPGHDALRDYAPIAVVATIPSVLAVHPSVPARTLADLTKLTRSQSGRISFGSGSSGSPSHLAGELYMSLTQSKILLVPYKGATFEIGRAHV